MMTSEGVQEELARCRNLLSRDRAGALRETQPEVSPESLGALAGIGFEDREGGVRLSVYVIPGADNQDIAVDRLRSRYPDRPDVTSRIGNNGPLLIFAHTTGSGSAGAIPPDDRLAEIVTAFAGDE